MSVWVLSDGIWKGYVFQGAWEFPEEQAIGIAFSLATSLWTAARVMDRGRCVVSYSYDPIARRAALDE